MNTETALSKQGFARSSSELDQAKQWLDEGLKVVLVTVINTWGSSPRPVGSHLAVNELGEFCGSVSSGCIEGAVVQEALEVLSAAEPRTLEFGVSTEQAWEVGLSCGGTIHVYLQQIDSETFVNPFIKSIDEGLATAVLTRLSDGFQVILNTSNVQDVASLGSDVVKKVSDCLLSDKSISTEFSGEKYFIRTYTPSAKLIIIGAVHIAQALAPMAEQAGFSVSVIDPRPAFATSKRFASTELISDWPDTAVKNLQPDAGTAVVTLTHDPKLDDAALAAAFTSPAFYIGSLGSRKTHGLRKERLTEQGYLDQLDRIHAPVGLDLGGRSPSEIAVSIMAQIIKVKYGTAGVG